MKNEDKPGGMNLISLKNFLRNVDYFFSLPGFSVNQKSTSTIRTSKVVLSDELMMN